MCLAFDSKKFLTVEDKNIVATHLLTKCVKQIITILLKFCYYSVKSM